LLCSISSNEIAEWAAYYQLDPFGSHRIDLGAAIVASTMANIHAKKGHQFRPSDFMPTFGAPEPVKTMTPQEIHDRLSMMFGRTPRG
jgi:hypothetical protein